MSEVYEKMQKLQRLADDPAASQGEKDNARRKIGELYEGISMSDNNGQAQQTQQTQQQQVQQPSAPNFSPHVSPQDRMASNLKLAALMEQAVAKGIVAAMCTPITVQAMDYDCHCGADSDDECECEPAPIDVSIPLGQLLMNVHQSLQEVTDELDRNSSLVEGVTDDIENQQHRKKKKRKR